MQKHSDTRIARTVHLRVSAGFGYTMLIENPNIRSLHAHWLCGFGKCSLIKLLAVANCLHSKYFIMNHHVTNHMAGEGREWNEKEVQSRELLGTQLGP